MKSIANCSFRNKILVENIFSPRFSVPLGTQQGSIYIAYLTARCLCGMPFSTNILSLTGLRTTTNLISILNNPCRVAGRVNRPINDC